MKPIDLYTELKIYIENKQWKNLTDVIKKEICLVLDARRHSAIENQSISIIQLFRESDVESDDVQEFKIRRIFLTMQKYRALSDELLCYDSFSIINNDIFEGLDFVMRNNQNVRKEWSLKKILNKYSYEDMSNLLKNMFGKN